MSSTAQVNRPTNVKDKEADVNRKLQFYGIITALRNGKVPSNEQIDIALNSFLASRAMTNPSNELSDEGKILVQDFRDVVEQAKVLLLSKNQGDLLQDFIWQTERISGGGATLPGAPVDSETAKQHGRETLEGIRTLGTLIISNGQFRKLLNDASILIRDMVGDAATSAASKVKPSEEQLSQIDKPAEDNVWHDVPDVSAGNIKQQIKSTYNKQTPVTKDDVRSAAGNASENAHPSGSRDPADTAALAAQDQQQGTNSGVDVSSGAQAGIATIQQRASENVPDRTKEKSSMSRDRAKNYLSSKMPEDRRNQTIWRLRKMVVEIQGHPDYQQAITTLLDLAETYTGHANTMGQQSTNAVKGVHEDNALKRAEADLKTLIERFANGTSTDNLFRSINQIYVDAAKDPELKSWFKKVDTYIRKCLKEQGYIMEDAATEEYNALYDRGNFLLRDRYRNHTDRIIDETKFLADQFDQDPLNKRFGNSMRKLFNDLGNDKNGKPTFKPHLVKDLTEIIIPAGFENIRYVPIPRIEYRDPMIDAVIENLVIESDNLMPNICEIANDNYVRWGRKKIANKHHHSVTMHVSGIQMDLRDVAYYVKRKKGIPTITDQGIADIFLGGSGFSFKMKMSTAEKTDRQNFFKVDKVDVDVKNFNIKLKESRHKLLFRMVKPFMLRVIRPALQKALEKQIKDQVNQFDTFAWQIKQEADRARMENLENEEDVPNIYQRYVSATQKQFLQRKQNTQAKDLDDKKINMAVTKHDSIFPNIHLKGGISTKATEYKEMARSGDTWYSPVFKLGTASTSSNIPDAPAVTRKDHSVMENSARDRQNIRKDGSMSNQPNGPAAQATSATEGGVRGPQNISNNGSMSDQPNGSAAQATDPARGYATNGSAMNTSANRAFSNQIDQAFSTESTSADVTNGKTTIGRTTLDLNQPATHGSS